MARICGSVVRSPAEVAGYLAGFTLGLRFLTFGTIVCLAVRRPGQPASAGLLVAFQAVVYLFVMAFVDATLVVVEVLVGRAGRADHPARQLRRRGAGRPGHDPDAVPQLRPAQARARCPSPSDPGVSDAATLIGVTVAAMAICMAGLLCIFHFADPACRPALALVLPVPFAEGSFVVRTAAAGPRQRVHRASRPAGRRPSARRST